MTFYDSVLLFLGVLAFVFFIGYMAVYAEKKDFKIEKEIKVAASWWANQLRTKPRFDNGDPKTRVLFEMVQDQQLPLPHDAADSFEKELVAGLTWLYDKRREYYEDPVIHIDVDYGPCRTLREAADRSGVDIEMRLPVKTTMWIKRGAVEVACGYRAPKVVIYEK